LGLKLLLLSGLFWFCGFLYFFWHAYCILFLLSVNLFSIGFILTLKSFKGGGLEEDCQDKGLEKLKATERGFIK